MVRLGLLVRLHARKGKDEAVEDFLRSALPLVRREAGTTAWFGIRFRRSEYGIFDTFPDEASRSAHLDGPVAKALFEHSQELFAKPPEIHRLDVLADKLPDSPPNEPDRKGFWLRLNPKAGKETQLEQFLHDARPLVLDEPKTTAWFAVQLEHGEYGIFDVFPDNPGRIKHLTGKVPRELLKHGRSMLGGVPRMNMLKVTAEKLPV
jgi:quinol monooxygenase YgiN